MTAEQSQADNITMSGGGLYSLATIGAKDVIDKATPMVLNALDGIANPPLSPRHWCFSDMGCADGGTSLGLWRAVAEKLHSGVEPAKQTDIQIVYADQARNDFNALVQILHGLTQFDSYLGDFPNLHALESGSSFYLPILPRQSLHLGFSATAMHWLREKPCNISDHVHMVGARGTELEQFAIQAAKDWETILLHRSRELSRGGKLVLVNFCQDEQGFYLGNTGGVNMFDNFNRIWQQFVDDGVITGPEYEAMTLPQYYNTVEEFSAPLTDSSNPVYQSGLRLEGIQTDRVSCPFAKDYKRHGDAQKFARDYIPTIRTWNESIYRGALADSRAEQEKTELIESYYQTYQREVEAAPEQHSMDYVHAYMTLAKE